MLCSLIYVQVYYPLSVLHDLRIEQNYNTDVYVETSSSEYSMRLKLKNFGNADRYDYYVVKY